jgi:hypothetical protein
MRFGTRDLMWLTAIIALAAGWSVDRIRMNVVADELRQMKAKEDMARSELGRAFRELEAGPNGGVHIEFSHD